MQGAPQRRRFAGSFRKPSASVSAARRLPPKTSNLTKTPKLDSLKPNPYESRDFEAASTLQKPPNLHKPNTNTLYSKRRQVGTASGCLDRRTQVLQSLQRPSTKPYQAQQKQKRRLSPEVLRNSPGSKVVLVDPCWGCWGLGSVSSGRGLSGGKSRWGPWAHGVTRSRAVRGAKL